jgi:hypothetical protein
MSNITTKLPETWKLLNGNSGVSLQDLTRAVLIDLVHPDKHANIGPAIHGLEKSLKVGATGWAIDAVSHLTWAESARLGSNSVLKSGLTHPLGLPYPLGVLLIETPDENPALQQATLEKLHREWCASLGDDPKVNLFARRNGVLIVIVRGDAGLTPDLYAAAMRASDGDGASDEGRTLGVLRVLVDAALQSAAEGRMTRETALSRALEPLVRMVTYTRATLSAAGKGEPWREAFGSFDTSRAYDAFRGKLRGTLERTMRLIERSTGASAKNDESLQQLREAASILAFRVFFITAIESRRLLYAPGFTPKYHFTGLTDAREKAPESSFMVLQDLTAAIRGSASATGHRRALKLAVSGASIFANRPNEHFSPELEAWLDALDGSTRSLADKHALRNEWDAVIADFALLATGQMSRYLDAAERAEESDISVGGSAHVQRVLGDVYEQILAMAPVAEGSGSGRVVRLVPPSSNAAKAKATGASKSGASQVKAERKALGAHYTPEALVLEVVRAALEPAFAAAWKRAKEKTESYAEELLGLRLLDPAMGSAHFLTVSALEIAREIAYAEHFRAPRPASHFEYIDNANPWLSITEATRKGLDERAAALLQRVAERCCFGVDIAPLAVELGKLALWQLTMVERAARGHNEDAPPPSLTFLDGNLRCGDSLLGATWKDVVALCTDFALEGADGDLFSQSTSSPKTAVALIQQLEPLLTGPADKLRAEVQKSRSRIAKEIQALPANLPDDDHALRRLVFELLQQGKEQYRWLWDLAFLRAWNEAGHSRGGEDALRRSLKAGSVKSWPAVVGLVTTTPAQQKARDAIREQARELRAFHWELEFYDVFHRPAKGFDLIVANPPFLGDRDLRAARGEQGVQYLRERYTDGSTPDLCGFFVLGFHAHLSPTRGVAGTVTPNTLAQGKNRESALVPIVAGSPAKFEIYRSCQSRKWPGEAAVHIATIHLRRVGISALAAKTRRIVQVFSEASDPSEEQTESTEDEANAGLEATNGEAGGTRLEVVSLNGLVDCSFLDGGAEVELAEIPGQKTIAYTGMFARGPFDRPLEFLQTVPRSERHAVYAYLNNRDVQQQPEPIAQRVIIDVYDALVEAGLVDAAAPKQEAWLKAKLPTLYKELKSTVYPVRHALPDSGSNAPHKELWWLFGSVREGLRAGARDLHETIAIGRTGKHLKPIILPRQCPATGLAVCLTEKLYLVPSSARSTFAVFNSPILEILTRRMCSTLKSDMNFAPTDVMPYFPFPWKGQPMGNEHIAPVLNPPPAVEKRLAPVAEELLRLRKELLMQPTRHGLSAGEFRGPTALYNAFDNPDEKRPPIEKLREIHRRLEAAVLAEYGWTDLADASRWVFDRPWIDGTWRYVPNQATRREYLSRLAKLNHEQASKSAPTGAVKRGKG